MMMGRIVKAMGSGKTLTGVILSELVEGKTLFVTNNSADARNTVQAYRSHNSTLEEGKQKSVGSVFKGQKEFGKDITVCGFYTLESDQSENIDWEDLGLIIVDEADVTSLSTKRLELLMEKSREYGIPVVAMSATTRQASGKRLEHAFPGEIFQWSVPEYLHKYHAVDVIPELSFTDLYVDCEFEIDVNEMLKDDFSEPTVNDIVRTEIWANSIIDHYLENFLNSPNYNDQAPGLIVLRDNIGTENFIQAGRKKGVKIAAFTGQESIEEQSELERKLKSGEIDLLIGSKLLERGRDLPEAVVVYNSKVTKSPQLFWQTNGRVMRKDPLNPNKIGHIVVVLPRKVINKTSGQAVTPQKKPLSCATFFEESYFDPPAQEQWKKSDQPIFRKSRSSKLFQLHDIKQIRSIDKVMELTGKHNKREFNSRIKAMAAFIEQIESSPMSYGFLQMISNNLTAELVEGIEQLRDSAYTQSLSENDINLESFGLLLDQIDSIDDLSRDEEKMLFTRYNLGRFSRTEHKEGETGNEEPYEQLGVDAKEAKQKIIEAYLPIVTAIAKNLIRTGFTHLEIDELINIGTIGLCEAVERFDHSRGGSFIKPALSYIINELYYQIPQVENTLNIPRAFIDSQPRIKRSTTQFEEGIEAKVQETKDVIIKDFNRLFSPDSLDIEQLNAIISTAATRTTGQRNIYNIVDTISQNLNISPQKTGFVLRRWIESTTQNQALDKHEAIADIAEIKAERIEQIRQLMGPGFEALDHSESKTPIPEQIDQYGAYRFDSKSSPEIGLPDSIHPDLNLSGENLTKRELQKVVNDRLSTLTEQEAAVLEMRFGLNNTPKMTLEEAGVELNVTGERVRQIEAKALRKLRHHRHKNHFRPFFNGNYSLKGPSVDKIRAAENKAFLQRRKTEYVEDCYLSTDHFIKSLTRVTSEKYVNQLTEINTVILQLLQEGWPDHEIAELVDLDDDKFAELKKSLLTELNFQLERRTKTHGTNPGIVKNSSDFTLFQSVIEKLTGGELLNVTREELFIVYLHEVKEKSLKSIGNTLFNRSNEFNEKKAKEKYEGIRARIDEKIANNLKKQDLL